MPLFNPYKLTSVRRNPYPTHSNSSELPFAAEIHTSEFEAAHIQEAKPVLDWDILEKRMLWHLDMAVEIVHLLFREADRQETRGAMKSFFGWLFSDKELRQSANNDYNNANETRKFAFKAGLGYFGIALTLEMGYWLVTQGVVKRAYLATRSVLGSMWDGLKSLAHKANPFAKRNQDSRNYDFRDDGSKTRSATLHTQQTTPGATVVAPPTVVSPPTLLTAELLGTNYTGDDVMDAEVFSTETTPLFAMYTSTTPPIPSAPPLHLLPQNEETNRFEVPTF